MSSVRRRKASLSLKIISTGPFAVFSTALFLVYLIGDTPTCYVAARSAENAETEPAVVNVDDGGIPEQQQQHHRHRHHHNHHRHHHHHRQDEEEVEQEREREQRHHQHHQNNHLHRERSDDAATEFEKIHQDGGALDQELLDGNVGDEQYSNITDPETIKEKAIKRLMQVFGIHVLPLRSRASHPPQYMLDLFNSIADGSGITRKSNPYDANVIRSFPDRDLNHQLHFMFNVSGVSSNENILRAELHIFKLRPRMPTMSSQTTTSSVNAWRSQVSDPRTHLLEMRVYQIMDESKAGREEGNRLLDARRISALSIGWEVFRVKPAVLDWLKNESTNFGLLVTLRSVTGERVNDTLVRIAKRHHHSNKQPILVLFTDDGRPIRPSFPTTEDPNEARVTTEIPEDTDEGHGANETLSTDRSRQIRSASSRQARSSTSTPAADVISSSTTAATQGASSQQQQRPTDCSRYELYVDFKKIGWDDWIISPKGYNAHYCQGACSFPLGQNQRPTNHATVQSIVHELRLHDQIGTPCCVPNKLLSISLLYYGDYENVILKQYDDMVVASCGCH